LFLDSGRGGILEEMLTDLLTSLCCDAPRLKSMHKFNSINNERILKPSRKANERDIDLEPFFTDLPMENLPVMSLIVSRPFWILFGGALI
jgi:hypothetical protein